MADPLQLDGESSNSLLWRSAGHAAEWLTSGLNLPVELRLTQNRVSRLSVRFKSNRICVRMREEFLHATPAFWRTLKKFLADRTRLAWSALCREMNAFPLPAPPTLPRKPFLPLQPKGDFHDLTPILKEINDSWSWTTPSPCITWGPHRRKVRATQTIHFAAYHAEFHLIRIHPILDDPRIPNGFLSFLVFHERLHAELGREQIGCRFFHHSPRFRMRESEFPNAAHWRDFSRSLIPLLLAPRVETRSSLPPHIPPP